MRHVPYLSGQSDRLWPGRTSRATRRRRLALRSVGNPSVNGLETERRYSVRLQSNVARRRVVDTMPLVTDSHPDFHNRNHARCGREDGVIGRSWCPVGRIIGVVSRKRGSEWSCRSDRHGPEFTSNLPHGPLSRVSTLVPGQQSATPVLFETPNQALGSS